MKSLSTILVAAAILLVANGGPAWAGKTHTLSGDFVWSQGSSGDLEAVFTETGEHEWDVAFRFEFRGKQRVFSGSATGSLSEGGLKGEVRNEDEQRTFTFEGSFEDGVFRGTHAETTQGRAKKTGTISLSE